MNADLLGRIDTAALYQPFLERLNAVLLACRARGQDYVVTSGLRTWAEQERLYAKGRTTPGGRVTNAQGGHSKHNFGVAVDAQPHLPNFPAPGGLYQGKLAVVPREFRGDTDPYYAIWGEEAERAGLEWGGRWPPPAPHDTPHVQLPLSARGITLGRMRAWYLEGGFPAVFAHLDVRGPW